LYHFDIFLLAKILFKETAISSWLRKQVNCMVYLTLDKEVMRADLQPLSNAPVWLATTEVPFHGRNTFGV
jgi:hypothetical protein